MCMQSSVVWRAHLESFLLTATRRPRLMSKTCCDFARQLVARLALAARRAGISHASLRATLLSLRGEARVCVILRKQRRQQQKRKQGLRREGERKTYALSPPRSLPSPATLRGEARVCVKLKIQRYRRHSGRRCA